MKVLIYSHNFPPSEGGIATYTWELCSGLAEQGLDVLVLAPDHGSTNVVEGCSFFSLTPAMNHDVIKLRHYLAASKKLKAVIASEKPDILHCCNVDALFTTALLSANIPRVFTIHGTEIIRNFSSKAFLEKITARIIQQCLNKASRIIAVSDYTRQLINYHVNLMQPEHVITVYNGTDLSIPEMKDKKSSEPKLLSVGRLVEFKGFHLFPKIFAGLCEVFPDITWTIAGDGPLRSKLESDLEELGVHRRVYFLGNLPRAEMAEVYLNHDLLIHPATIDQIGGSESFGLVLVEAMLCGTPIVTMANGGIPEIINHMDNGFLCDMTRPDQALEQLLNLLRNPSLMRQIAQNARLTAQQKFSRKAMAEATLEIYRSAISTANCRLSFS